MREWVNGHFPLVLCVLMLLPWSAMVVTNRLASPTGRLVPSRLGRRFRAASIVLLAFPIISPFFNTAAAVTILVFACLAASVSLANLWLARALGEEVYLATLQRAARNSSLASRMLPGLASAMLIGLAGSVMLYLSGGPGEWAFFTAIGVLLFAVLFAAKTVRGAMWLSRQGDG